MARIRTIKPEFPQSETMGKVSRDARLLFIQIWTVADDSGRARGHSRVLASLLYPYDDDARDLLPGWLDELEAVGAIRRYVVQGDTYLEVCNWLKHQKIDKPSGPKCPGFDEGSPRLREEVASPPRGTGTTTPTSTTTTTGTGSTSVGPKPDRSADTRQVFDHWRQTHRHPAAKLDAKRRRLLATALDGYTPGQLCDAITGYLNSPHHMGQNDRSTVYDDIGLFLRDAAHIDAGLRYFAEPPRTDLSKLTRKNVAAVADWVPPEMRAQRAAS